MNGRISPQPYRLGTRGRRLASTSALCAALCAFAAAPAAALTQADADALRADIEAFLTSTGDSTVDWGAAGFSFRSGEVSVDALDESYEILIPDLVIVYDEPPSDYQFGEPGHLEITLGDLHATMTPDPVDDDLAALQGHFGDGGPVTFTVDAGDDEGATIDIGSHGLDGLWSNTFGYFVSGGFAFEDVVASSLEGEAGGPPDNRISLGLLSSSSDLTEVEPGLWDGGADFVLEDLAAEERGEIVFSVERFALEEAVTGFAFQDYLAYLESNPMMAGSMPEGISEEEAAEIFRQAIVDLPTIIDDFTIGWTLDGLQGGEGRDRVIIGHHEFEFSMFGLAGDTSNWNLRTLLTGMSIPEDPSVPPQFVPTLVDFNFDFSNVPTGLAWQAMEEAIATTPIDAMDDIGPLLAQQMLQLVMQAQTGTTLDGEIDWQTGNVTFDGEVHADPASPMMVGGSLAIVVREMQAFIREVENVTGPEAASMLTLFQSMGQQEEGDQGPETVFEFVIDGTNVLMNGQDLEPIVQMLSR